MRTTILFSILYSCIISVSAFAMSNATVTQTNEPTQQHALDTQPDVKEAQQPVATQKAPAQQGTLVSWISKTMEQSNSLIIRLLMVFLLGLLMSLTPCIYPMIPITAGILQAQASRSLFMSFLLASVIPLV